MKLLCNALCSRRAPAHKSSRGAAATHALACMCVVLFAPQRASADGGQVRLSETVGPYRVTVFSQPAPLRAGPVDISALVLDERTGAVVDNVEAVVTVAPDRLNATAVRHPATRDAATNKLLRSAKFTLPRAGRYAFTIRIAGAQGTVETSFAADAAPALPRAAAYWPWFAPPLIGVLWFGIAEFLTRRARHRRTRTHVSTAQRGRSSNCQRRASRHTSEVFDDVPSSR